MRKKVGPGRKITGGFILMLALWMIFSPTAQALRALPQTYRLSAGQRYALPMGVAALSSQDETLASWQGNTLEARGEGEVEMTVNLFGLFPIGRMRAKIDGEKRLVPGGMAVGVALATKGVMLVGVSDVAGKSPAQAAGLRAGDIISAVNGRELSGSEELVRLVSASQGAPLTLRFVRDGKEKNATLLPLQDAASGAWRMGAWVRDSTAGVGTLSYYDPESGTWGALGHAINDADTGKLLPVKTGSLLKAEIVDVRRGARGNPGELRGSFLREKLVLGSIAKNTQLGIYGAMDQAFFNPLYPDGVPIGYQESVQIGPATILSTVDGGGVRAYQVEITQINRQLRPGQKGMVLRVTDQELLQKTGGIVQGMSGSPILQNGRIIGAVTHVFVDDPTQGYGLFIEWMLDTAQAAADAA